MHTIELLSPARDAACGIEAIRCGADAVYIGAHHFGARAEAANTTDDIRRLTEFAHLYGAKVYVALNTIIYEQELSEAFSLVEELIDIGVDALITQDVALLKWKENNKQLLSNSHLHFHASTQMDNRTSEQVQFLHDNGFSRVILARELGIKEICDIHRHCPDIELEAFVHGALCVSYSGRCYASQLCFGRSANRGECAQFCRLPFNLEDTDGNKIIENRHLLSLKDMNRSDYLEEMIDAGVCSFKIEGRLKDIGYVKNITSYYNKRLNDILKHKEGYRRLSYGQSHIPFQPDPQKSFNRGFTDYFLHGRTKDIFSFNTPKALGEAVGEVKEIYDHAIKVTSVASFSNGDGLCFFDNQNNLQGFRVNKAQNNILFPNIMPKGLKIRTPLYRNHDEAFQKQLLKAKVERTLLIDITLSDTEEGFMLAINDETGRQAILHFDITKELARSPQEQRQKDELSKLGGTIFSARKIDIHCSDNFFIPASSLSEWRRQAIQKLSAIPIAKPQKNEKVGECQQKPLPQTNIDYSYNVSNDLAKTFYLEHGAMNVAPAFELEVPKDAIIMTCKHCIRHALGFCKKEKHSYKDPLKEPLFLCLDDGRRFQLKFDCSQCQMLIYATH